MRLKSKTIYKNKTIIFYFRKGYRVAAYHNRGVNNTKLSTPFPMDGINLNDLKTPIQMIRARYPNAKIYGCGLCK